MKLYGGHIRDRGDGAEKKTGLADFFGKKWVRVLTVIMAVTGTLIIAGVAWWNMNIVPPEIPEVEIPETVELPQFDINRTPRPADAPSSTPAPVSRRKAGVYTFLFLGKENDGNTDTIMVGMLDTVNEVFNIVSIPRDTMVNVRRSVKRINAAYGMGESSGKGNGILQLKGELETVIGFVPDFYAVVNYNGFIRLVNTMGGVDFNVPKTMYKILDDMVIDLEKGQKKLNGDEALQLVRYRDYNGTEGYGHDDYGRMAVQQEFLRAMGRQAISLGNLFKLGEFLKIAEENLTSDMSGTTLMWIATTVLGYGTECLNFYTLPTESVRYNRGWYEHVLVDEALEMINAMINPFTRDITADDLDILLLND